MVGKFLQLKQCIQEASQLAGMENQARHLLLAIINQPATFLLTHPEFTLTPAQTTRYQAQLAQLKKGKPLAYVLGNQPFWSLDFLVNEHTLIPRPDTETLVEQALKQGDEFAKQWQVKALHVLDLGTGSGIVGICLKHERPHWQVTATDQSQPALEVAQKNALRNNTAVTFLQGSWYEAVSCDEKFHLIVSNPPYIAPDDEHLAQLTDEPMSALVAENAGMADIAHIIQGAKVQLHSQGWLLLEHGYNQAAAVSQCFEEYGFKQIRTVKDYGGNDRVTMGQIFLQEAFL